MKKNVLVAGLLASVALLPSVVLAAPVAIDTADAVAQVGAAGTAISAIGVAIIALAALALGYRWVKATFF